jgi:hypothetical protein
MIDEEELARKLCAFSPLSTGYTKTAFDFVDENWPRWLPEARAAITYIEALEAENARLRNALVDAIEIIEEELPGEFDVWIIAARAALKGDE